MITLIFCPTHFFLLVPLSLLLAVCIWFMATWRLLTAKQDWSWTPSILFLWFWHLHWRVKIYIDYSICNSLKMLVIVYYHGCLLWVGNEPSLFFFLEITTFSCSSIIQAKLFHYRLCQPWHLVHQCILSFKSCWDFRVAVKGYRAGLSSLHIL